MLDAKTVMPTLAVTDLDRAREFYERKLGLKRSDKGPKTDSEILYELRDGSHLLVYEREKPPTTDVTSASFLVDDFDRAISELKDAGVKLEEYDQPGLRTENGVADMDGMKAAWFKDPFGNVLNVTKLPS